MSRESTILIVDDDPIGSETLAAALLSQNYRLFFASSGMEALDLAAKIEPDLILLDVMMPGMDGFEVCRRLRSDALLSAIPIIMLTALNDRDSRLCGIEAGADSFISKPFDRVELRARVRTITRLNRYQRLMSERKRADSFEEERHQIAYELHDGLAQLVTSVHQHLQAYAGHQPPRALQTGQELDRLLDLARQSVQEVRRAIDGLRPTALEDFGLTLAIQMIVAAMRADSWEVAYLETLGEERLPPTTETVLFRVAQEALLNVSKHSQGKRVYLTLERQRQCVQLTVQDWGCGFDPLALSAAGVGQQRGLLGMRERVAALGGQWSLQSSPGAGTLIIAEIPLPIDGKREGAHET